MPFDITLMWNLKYGSDELVCKIEASSQTWKRDLRLPGEEGDGEGGTVSLGLVDANCYIFKG